MSQGARSITDRIRVVAHRGASEDAPEHTLAAYEKAIEDGADGLEADIRLTSDGHLVCVHDRRLDRTSNGRGPISTVELADLVELDFAAWSGDRRWQTSSEAPDRTRSGILTLDRLLGVVRDAGRPIELAIETKHPTRYAGLVERRLVETLDRFGMAHPHLGVESAVRVMSFSWVSLRRIQRLAPTLNTVLLLDRAIPLHMRSGSLPVGVSAVGPSISLVNSEPVLVRRFKKRGHQVHVWTVNHSLDLERCRRLGVDVVITDRPSAVLKELGRRRNPGGDLV